MTNFKKASGTQNQPDTAKRINYAHGHQTPVSGTTSQRKVTTKIELSITRGQLSAATRLFKEYGKPKPSWLRQKFYINQRRRKCLNTELMEAQLDRAYCGHHSNVNEWDGQLHCLWHLINGEPLCN